VTLWILRTAEKYLYSGETYLAKIPDWIKEGATPLLITTSNNVFPARYSVVMTVINLSPPTRRTFTLMNGYFLLNNSKYFV